MSKTNGTMLVAPLQQPDIEDRQAMIELERIGEARRRDELTRLIKPREDVVARLKVERKDSYPISDVLDEVTQAILSTRPGAKPDNFRTTDLWRETRSKHATAMLAMLASGVIEATNIESGTRAYVTDGWPLNGLAELSINHTGYGEFGKVVGVEFEGTTKTEVRRDQYQNLLHIIGALSVLIVDIKGKEYGRSLASIVAQKIQKATGRSIIDKTVRRYLKEAAQERGFKIDCSPNDTP